MFTISAKTVDSILDKAKLSLPKLPVCLNCNSFCPLSIDYNTPAKVTFDCKKAKQTHNIIIKKASNFDCTQKKIANVEINLLFLSLTMFTK